MRSFKGIRDTVGTVGGVLLVVLLYPLLKRITCNRGHLLTFRGTCRRCGLDQWMDGGRLAMLPVFRGWGIVSGMVLCDKCGSWVTMKPIKKEGNHEKRKAE